MLSDRANCASTCFFACVPCRKVCPRGGVCTVYRRTQISIYFVSFLSITSGRTIKLVWGQPMDSAGRIWASCAPQPTLLHPAVPQFPQGS